MLLPMVQSQLNGMIETAGIDLNLKRDLLDNLGSELIFLELSEPAATTVSAEQQSDAIPTLVIPLYDPQRVGWALEELRKLVAPDPRLVEVRNFRGLRIWTIHRAAANSSLPSQGPLSAMSLAIVGDSLVVCRGEVEALDRVREQFKPGRVVSMTRKTDLSSCLNLLPGGYHALWFESSGVLEPAFSYCISQLISAQSACTSRQVTSPAARSGPLATVLYLDDHSLIVRSRLVLSKR
jgi:hypothetical protein